jgi:Flp pilus assembly protein TadG
VSRFAHPKRKTRAPAGRCAADRRGAAAVEFALLLPLLTLMLTSVWQYGMLFYTYNTISVAARDGARALANGSATEADVQAVVLASLPKWVSTDDVTVVARNASTTGTGLVDTSISVPAAKATFLSVVPMPENIQAFVTMEDES